MLIALAGPSSCGKGTVLYDLESSGYSVINRQYARELMTSLRLTVKEIESFAPSDLLYFHYLLKNRKQEVESPFITTPELVFTERSFIDFYIYYFLYKHEHSTEFLKECINSTLSFYKKVIYLSECPYIEDDGVRITNQAKINSQKDLFSQFFSTPELSDRVISISELDRSKRISIITNLIGTISNGQ